MHRIEDNRDCIVQNYGDQKKLTFPHRNWRVLPTPTDSVEVSAQNLESRKQTVLSDVIKLFRKNPFIRQQAQGFEQAAVITL